MYVRERPPGPSFAPVSETEITRSMIHVFAQAKFRCITLSRETIRILVNEVNQRRRDFPTIPYIDILRAVFLEKLDLIGETDIQREAYKSAVAYIQANRGHSSIRRESGPRHDQLPPAVRQEIEDDVWQDIRQFLASQGRSVFTPHQRRLSR
ncbi:MAG: hypothetical protein JWO58_3350 [Chitinophagaceae bacterium]|nr:hypothetical protein [Chitinophagaceae bacterium]